MRNVHIRSFMVPFAVAAVLIASVPVSAAAHKERPIKEDLSGYATGMQWAPNFPDGDTFEGRCSQPSQWVSSSAGSGVISHLGRVSWRTEHCFQLFAGTFGTFGDARLVITAANGDQLFGTYDGVMTGETTFAETVFVTGGTGRFAQASGSIDESGWFDPDTGFMEVTGAGSIAYDASDRASRD